MFRELKVSIHDWTREKQLARIKRSPMPGVSIDEKRNHSTVIIASVDPSTGKPTRELLDYDYIPGHSAKDLFAFVMQVFDSHGLDVRKVHVFTADGASVNGTRKGSALDGTMEGDNVSHYLKERIGHQLLVAHCCTHKWALCANSSWRKVPYFKEMEKRIKALHNHIHFGPKACQDVVFWAGVTDEKVVQALSTGKARWLSCLAPMKKVMEFYVTIMACR